MTVVTRPPVTDSACAMAVGREVAGAAGLWGEAGGIACRLSDTGWLLRYNDDPQNYLDVAYTPSL